MKVENLYPEVFTCIYVIHVLIVYLTAKLVSFEILIIVQK